MQPDASTLRHDAGWHLHDFVPGAHLARLLHLREEDFRAASFLDQRIEAQAQETLELPLRTLQAAFGDPPGAAPAHFIFHLGHCGSTLLSRALAAAPGVLPLREPLTLRRLSAGLDGGAEGADWPHWLGLSLAAHARVFRPGQRALVKATSICSNLAAPILERSPDSRAVLMHVSLETLLAGLLGRNSPASDLHGHKAARQADWSRIAGAPALDMQPLREAELAALAWLTGMRQLLRAAARFPGRTLLLDFEHFLQEPEALLQRTAQFLGLSAGIAEMLTAWPDVASGYSKQPDQPYSAFNRRRTLQRGRETRAAEIRRGLQWAESMIAATPELAACGPYLDNTPATN